MCMNRNRKCVASRLLMATLLTGVVLEMNCATNWSIFRQAATIQIGEGLKGVLAGVVDGLVAVTTPTQDSKT